MNTNDEILLAAQKNGSKGKEYDQETLKKGDTKAVTLVALIGAIMIVFKLIMLKEFDFGLCGISCLITSVQFLNEGICLRKWFYIISGIFETAIALLCIYLFFSGVLA